MISSWSYITSFAAWTWHCARAWMEIGHRVQALELRLAEQSAEHERDDRQIRTQFTAAVASAKSGRERLHRRIDELDESQRKRLTEMERTQQSRIDDWARQLSGQINHVYMAVAAGSMSAAGPPVASGHSEHGASRNRSVEL